MVFAGLFPTDSDQYPELRDALEKLKLNDAALFYEPETSQALGFGFRCGFLGLLHMEIVRERLEREFDLDLLVTAPNVAYRVQTKAGEEVEVHNPAEMPREVEEVEEPYVKASIIVPKDGVGAVMELNNERRGRFDHMEYLSEERVLLSYDLPLGEIVLDYYDQLKSRTRGYASFDYDFAGFRPGDLTRVDILIAGEPVDALSLIIHRDGAYARGRALVERLRQEIPRQFFDVPIQAAIGSRVIARETIKAKRKDVLAKCYGGDISRKRKLLEQQKKGKKRMKQVGAVEVPQEAFLAVLNLDQREAGGSAGERDGVDLGRRRPGRAGAARGRGRERVRHAGAARRGAFMCRVREDGETLAIRCDLDERPFLVEANEGVLFVTPHYEAWPMVLVALPRAGEQLVRELVEEPGSSGPEEARRRLPRRRGSGARRAAGRCGPRASAADAPLATRQPGVDLLSAEAAEGRRVSGVRHLYVHLPFCAHRCGYCDFVTAVGRDDQHEAYVDALLAELELERGVAGASSRDRVPRRRDADVHRAGRARAAAGRAAGGGRGDRRGEPGDGHARTRPASVTKPCQSRVGRRAIVPAAPPGRARAARRPGRRPPRGVRSA